MSATATRTIAVSSEELESAIEALSSAGQTFQLTRFQRVLYQALMLSVDIGAASLIAGTVLVFWYPTAGGVFYFIFGLCVLVGLVCLLLNIPLFLKTVRESKRLKKLGLSPLSKSLWKESRRSQLVSRGRGWLLTAAAIITCIAAALFVAMGSASMGSRYSEWGLFLGLGTFFAIIAFVLFGARYLRNQKQQIELTSSANELRKALQGLRQRAGEHGVASVPSELLERTAEIESAQITEQRKDAVMRSVASEPTGYMITFDRKAAEQRTTLDFADRIELGDLVVELSTTDGAQPEPQLEAVTGGAKTRRSMTKSKRIEIKYVIDKPSQAIRIVSVQHVGGVKASPNGASHA